MGAMFAATWMCAGTARMRRASRYAQGPPHHPACGSAQGVLGDHSGSLCTCGSACCLGHAVACTSRIITCDVVRRVMRRDAIRTMSHPARSIHRHGMQIHWLVRHHAHGMCWHALRVNSAWHQRPRRALLLRLPLFPTAKVCSQARRQASASARPPCAFRSCSRTSTCA